jgi:hypothetical protein
VGAAGPDFGASGVYLVAGSSLRISEGAERMNIWLALALGDGVPPSSEQEGN